MLIDTHTHIYLDKFKDDIDEVIQRCRDIGIQKLYMPNIDLDSIKDVKNLAETYPGYCLPMMGLHPCSVNANYKEILDGIKAELYNTEYLAVGEIGVDLYWDKTTQVYHCLLYTSPSPRDA